LGPEETFLFLSSAAFDVSAFEIYGSLLNGSTLVIMESHKPSFVEIGDTIRRNRITSLCVTPQMLNLLLEDCRAVVARGRLPYTVHKNI
jgi:non-ribosomal peptide synthetase component F